MKDLVIADYIGNSGKNGEPTGHLSKQLIETDKLLNKKIGISYIVADNYVSSLSFLNIIETVPHLNCNDSRINRTIQRFKNIRKILSCGSNIWFINIDFWFYVFLIFFNIKGKNIYATNYCNYSLNTISFKSKVMWIIYKLSNKKLKCEFVTAQKKYRKNQKIIPDYYYDSSLYEKYRTERKRECVLFCGGITRAKEVGKVVDIFSKNKIDLEIKGKFEDDYLFSELENLKQDNIKIINKRLSEDEYYKSIASCKYIILPYKINNYLGRSSGVIVEALFLDSIIIAPHFLLNELDISGIGYDDLEELSNISIDYLNKVSIDCLSDNERRKEKYTVKTALEIYLDGLDDNDA